MMHNNNKGQLLLWTLVVQAYHKIMKIISLDARSLVLFRVVIALTTITDIMTRYPDAHHHYSDAGMFPREFILRSFTNYYWITVHMLSGSEFVIQLLFLLEIFIGFLMLIGYRTRTMTILSWIMVCSVQNRNYVLGHSGDTVHRLFLFWGIFLPLGRFCSLDRALEDARAPAQAHARELAHPHDVEEDTHGNEKGRPFRAAGWNKYEISNFATLVFVIQWLIMYYMAHFHKTSAEWRERGVAAWMALQLDYFRTWFGDILLLYTPGVIFGNFAVLRWQHYGPVMYFIPFYNEYFKAFVCLGFFAMHIGFGMAFYLETFTWATIAACCGGIPGWVWDVTFKYLGKLAPFSKPITIHVTPGNPFGAKLAYCMHQFMLPGKSKVVFSKFQPTTQPCSCGTKCNWDDIRFFGIYVTDNQKNVHHGSEVLSIISKSSPILYPLHFILRTQAVRTAIHTIVTFFYHPSQHRYDEETMEMEAAHSVESKFSYRPYHLASTSPHHLSATSSRMEGVEAIEASELSGVVIDPESSRVLGKKEFFAEQSGKFTLADVKEASKIGVRAAKEVFVCFLLILIISCNWGNVNHKMGVPSALQPVMWVFQLDQYWGMFAPRPPDITWWYNFEGFLDDGTHVELFNNGAMHTFTPNIPYTSEKPDIHLSIGNHRWFKLFENGINSHSQREDIRLYFGRWFCREYNSRYSGTKRLHKYSIHFVFERLDMAKLDGSRFAPARETIWNHLCYEK